MPTPSARSTGPALPNKQLDSHANELTRLRSENARLIALFNERGIARYGAEPDSGHRLPIESLRLTLPEAWAANGEKHDTTYPTDAASAPTKQAMPGSMMAAKPSGERSALMTEHMKTTQDGMAMMKGGARLTN